jgi:dihydroorotase
MVHHANSGVPLPEVLARLRSGDIYTHLYHPHADGGFLPDGAATPEMRDARARGVLFDVGHGKGAFSWRVAEAACRSGGFWPDTISTDVHRFNVRGPVYDLPTTMSKFLYLGMPLIDVIAATTSAPAEAMGRGDGFGRLLPGRAADVTLLRVEPGPWLLEDVLGETRAADVRLVPVWAFKRGRRFPCRPADLTGHV